MDTNKLLETLELAKFPNNTHRRVASNYGPCRTITFGLTGLPGRSWESSSGKKFPDLYLQLKNLASKIDPNFKYTSITVNKNFRSFPHYDFCNKGMSMIIAIGNFTGGRLIVEDVLVDIHNKVHYFDGSKQLHHTEDFQGTRYSMIFFTRKTWETKNSKEL